MDEENYENISANVIIPRFFQLGAVHILNQPKGDVCRPKSPPSYKCQSQTRRTSGRGGRVVEDVSDVRRWCSQGEREDVLPDSPN